MSADTLPSGDDDFLGALARCDEALAAGLPVPGPQAPAELREALSCIRLLREALGGPDDGEPPAELDGLPLAAVGRFEVLRELGQGACGIVFLAYDPQLRREVALKVPRGEALLSPARRERFLREARAAASLSHPNIVAVHEAGEAGPLCYIAAELCPGGSLAAWLRGRGEPVPFREAAALVAPLADAVQHAHDKGVVHRDLKPGNVLLAAAGGPKITDFGLAKVFQDNDAQQTASGAILGTPSYMAPEQAAGKPGAVGPAADMYALGALLYELLTQRPPFRGDSVLDTLQQVRSEEPVPPRRLRPRVPRDLETICLKCLEKDPGKRYASARALADDLRRFLAGEPVRARPVGALERGAKWARRRPAVAALLAVVVAVTAAGFALVAWQWRTATAALAEAQSRLYFNRIALAERALAVNNVARAEELLDECPPELRQWEWHYLKRRCHADPTALAGHVGSAISVAFSPDGRHLATGGDDRTICIWDLQRGRTVSILRGHTAPVCALAYSPDGRLLASAGEDALARVWDVTAGQEVLTFTGHRNWVNAVAFSPDGRYVATASTDKTIQIWEPTTGRVVQTLRGHEELVHSVAFHPSGHRLASAGWDKTVRLWDLQTGREERTLREHGGSVHKVAFSPDGRWLASCCGEYADWGRGEVKLWDGDTLQAVRDFHGHNGSVRNLAFSPDGRRMATSGFDGTVKLWDTATGQEVLTVRDHTNVGFDIAFSPDGRRLATTGLRDPVLIHDTSPPERQVLRQPALSFPGYDCVAFRPDGRSIACATSKHTVTLWNLFGRKQARLEGHASHVISLAYSPDGKQLATSGWDGVVKLWDAGSGKEVATLRGPGGCIMALAYSPDGRRLAAAHWQRFSACVWDIASGRMVLESGRGAWVYGAAYSPDGKRLIFVREDRIVEVWDALTLKLAATFPTTLRNSCVAFHPNGRWFATLSGADGAATLWDLATGRELRKYRGASGVNLAFSPDGSLLACPTARRAVTVWETETGRERFSLEGPTNEIRSVAFSPDGKRLASASYDGTVLVWDLPAND